ncbi:MAG: hypothetical protein PVG14_04920 [Anaerolineales bacterium]|jgi:hypothetical protein
MSIEGNTPAKPSFSKRLGNAFVSFLRAFLRLLLLVVLIGIIWAGFYYGVPWLYRMYIQPVQENTSRLEDFQMDYQQDKDLITDRLDSMQARLEDLEIQSDNVKLALADIQTQLVDIDNTLEDHNSAIGGIAELSTALEEKGTALESLKTALDELSLSVEANAEEIQALIDQPGEQDEVLAELRQELGLLKIMDLVARARLSLIHNNLGQAEADVRTARGLLSDLRSQGPAENAEALTEILLRFDLAIEELPDAPDLATDDMEAAWGLLLRELSVEPVLIVEPLGETNAPLTSTPTPASEGSAISPGEESTAVPTEETTATQTPTPTPETSP